MTEAEIIHDLPARLAAEIGRLIVAFAKLEYQLTAMIGMLLQLQKAESRLAIKEPRLPERLDVVCDLFALKAIKVDFNFVKFRETLHKVETARNQIAHGIWLRHPKTKKLYLRLTKGHWPQQKSGNGKLKRIIFPESIPYGAGECRAVLVQIDAALTELHQLGLLLHAARTSFPGRFRPPAPVASPLGSHIPKRPRAPRLPSRG